MKWANLTQKTIISINIRFPITLRLAASHLHLAICKGVHCIH